MAQTVFSIQEYLDNASFPAFCKSFSKVFTTARKMNALPWPQYAELQVAPGTRLLKRVIRTENIKFVNLVMQYLDNIDAPLIDVAKFAGQDCPLRLPSRGYVTYQQRDANFFRQIDNEQKFCELMEYYVLHTVSETLRWIKGYPLGSPEAAALKFQKASHLRLAHHGRWDIMALPGSSSRPFPFFVFFISPEHFGVDDMIRFSDPRTFELRTGENQLDKPSTMEDTLWAVIHDTCKHKGRFFAVTNYTRWTFGELSSDDTASCITFPFEVPIQNLWNGATTEPIHLGCNTLDMLVFWVDWALRRQVPAS